MKAAISQALLVRGTCQYPFKRSNLLTYFADPTWSMQFLHPRKRVKVCFSNIVNFSIISAGSESGIRLFDQKTGWSPIWTTWLSNTIVQHILHLCFQLQSLLLRYTIKSLFDRLSISDVYVMFNQVGLWWGVRKQNGVVSDKSYQFTTFLRV